MATYNQISYGSTGSDVTELQKLLNQNGYSLDVDGIFGSKTQAAVKDYQEKNSLTVDGIVGVNTWGALTKASTSTATDTQTTTTAFEYGAYTPSDTVAQAEALLQQQLANKPGEYQSQWQSQLNDVINKILNREKFSYDLNGDALYQQYKDQYTTQGKMAMMDTMGQAAALTGGYGNSYAQSVGQQTYQGYLQQLNDKVPELYQLALNQYNQESSDLYNQSSLLATMEDQDYGRYRDQVSDYYTELDRLYSQYNTERDYDYSQWADGRDFAYGQYTDDRAYAYQAERDAVADAQWQAEFDEAVRQFNKSNSSSSSSSSYIRTSSKDGDVDGDSSDYNNGGFSSWVVKQAQKYVGATQDGKWGSDSAAKAKAKGYNSLSAVVAAMGQSTPTATPTTRNYSTVVADMNTYIRNGSSKSEINTYLRSAYQDGVISQAQYSQLKEQYAPRGSTY